MTQQRDIERLLDQWFADGSSVAPDRVVDIVADRIERQPQRPAWRLDWRHLTMNPFAKAGVAIAAVVLIAVVGYTLLPGTSGGVGGPAPTAIPTASPTTAPSPSPSAAASAAAVYPTWYTPEGGSLGAGILSAGSHTSRFTPAFTYTVPTGWINGRDDGDFHLLFPDTPATQAEHASSGDLAHAIQLGQVDQPYFVCEGLEKSGGTAAENGELAVMVGAGGVVLMITVVVAEVSEVHWPSKT